MIGRLHSIQSMGTLDGPGVRFVAFLQGCPLRCHCCHNPDTWDVSGGFAITAEALVTKASRFRSYFGDQGGITLSGGEPLMQPAFTAEVFTLCHEAGIHTCLDTSGWRVDEAVLDGCDRVLLDVKYTTDEAYRAYVGCGLDVPLTFLQALEERRIPTTLRQVVIPTINDTAENIRALKTIADAYACVDGIELLPFRKLCQTKYDIMQQAFPFAHLPEPTGAQMDALQKILKE